MASGFSITFSGEILESFDRESVKASFGERFRISGAQLDKVFAAKRVVLKKGLIEGQASVFRRELAAMGLRVDMRDATGAVVPDPDAQGPATVNVTAQRAKDIYDPIHRILYSGGILPGSGRERVMADAARRLKLGERQLKAVFSGREITLKQGLNLNEARRYFEVMCDLGMDVRCEPPLADRRAPAVPVVEGAIGHGGVEVAQDMMETVVWSNPVVQERTPDSDDDRLIAALRAEFDSPAAFGQAPAAVETTNAAPEAAHSPHLAQTMLNPDMLRTYLDETPDSPPPDAELEASGPVEAAAADEAPGVTETISEAAADAIARDESVKQAPPARVALPAKKQDPGYQEAPETVMVPLDVNPVAAVATPEDSETPRRAAMDKTTAILLAVIVALLVVLAVVLAN